MVVLSVAAVVAASATPSPASPGFLTGPSSEKPLAIVVGYLGQDLAEYGLQPGDVNLAIANAGVMPDGRLFAFDTRFVGA